MLRPDVSRFRRQETRAWILPGSSAHLASRTRSHHWCMLLAVVLATFLTCERMAAQTTSLSLSSAVGNPGQTAFLSLSLSASGGLPAGLEWTFAYPSSQISAIAA